MNPTTNKTKTLDSIKITKLTNSAEQKMNQNSPTALIHESKQQIELNNKDKLLNNVKDEENKLNIIKSPSIKNQSCEKKEEGFSDKIDLMNINNKKISSILPPNNKRGRNLKLFLNTSMSFDQNNNLDERRNFSMDNQICNSITHEKSSGKKKITLKSFLENKKNLNKKFSVLNQKKVLMTNKNKRHNLNKSAEECSITNGNYNQIFKEKLENNNYLNEILIKKKVKKTIDIKKYMFGCDL